MWAALGGALLGGLLGGESSRKAANTQADSAREAAALQKEMFEKNIELQEPFRQGGLAAQNKLLQYLGLQSGPDSGKYTRDFGMQDFQQDPGYAFRMSEGLKALDRQAAARGGLISGAALKAAQREGQNQASQEYMNAFNRYQTNRSNQLNPLQSLAGQAQTSANTLGTAGQNYANQAGEAYMGASDARASGYMGQGNALAGALNQGINAYGYNQMMKPGGMGVPGTDALGFYQGPSQFGWSGQSSE